MYFFSCSNSFFEMFSYEQWVIQSAFEIDNAFGRAKIDMQNFDIKNKRNVFKKP